MRGLAWILNLCLRMAIFGGLEVKMPAFTYFLTFLYNAITLRIDAIGNAGIVGKGDDYANTIP